MGVTVLVQYRSLYVSNVLPWPTLRAEGSSVQGKQVALDCLLELPLTCPPDVQAKRCRPDQGQLILSIAGHILCGAVVVSLMYVPG